MKRLNQQQDKERRFHIGEWKDQEAALHETKEAIIALAETGRKFPLTIAFLLERVEAFAVSREEALEKLADFDIMTEAEAIRAAVRMEGGAK